MIKLDENYWLEADQLQWTLKYKSVRIVTDPDTLEDKTVTSENQWYHGRLQHALQNYCDQKLREGGATNPWGFKDILCKISEVYTHIDSAVAQIKTTTGGSRNVKVVEGTPAPRGLHIPGDFFYGLGPNHGTYNKELPTPGENWPTKVSRGGINSDITMQITSMRPEDTYPATPEESFTEDELM